MTIRRAGLYNPVCARLLRIVRRLPVIIAVTLLVVWTAVPILWAVSASFKEPLEIYESVSLLPRAPRIDAYGQVIAMRGFGRWLLNSVVVTIVSTIIPMVLSILAAYSFARYRFRFAGILLMLFLVPRILPRVSLIIPLFDLIRVFGLLDRYGALFLTYTASAIPLAVWLMTGFFRTVPRELEDSAKLDGANLWILITRVIIPVAWPGVVTAAILCVREAWNEFPFVLSFMSSSSMRTLPYALYSLRDAMGIEDWARYNAFTILSILPLIAVFWVFQRRIVGSIISGSIK